MTRKLFEQVYEGEGTAWELDSRYSREDKPCEHPVALPAYTVVALVAGKIVPWNPGAADNAPEKIVYGALRGPYVPRTDADGDVVSSAVVVMERFCLLHAYCLAFPAGVNDAGTAANLAAAKAGLLVKQIKVR